MNADNLTPSTNPSRRCLYIALVFCLAIVGYTANGVITAGSTVHRALEAEADMLAYRISEIVQMRSGQGADDWIDAITPLIKRTHFEAISVKIASSEFTIGDYRAGMQASMRHLQTNQAMTISAWSTPVSRLVMQQQLRYAAAAVFLLLAGFLVYRDGQQRFLNCAIATAASEARSLPNPDELLRRLNEQKISIVKLQQQLSRAGNDCEDLQTVRSAMLASFSLELRTQLNAIIGYAELLIEDNQQLAAASSNDLRNILFAGKHLLTLINDVTDLTKIETGELQLKPEFFSVRTVANEIVAKLQPTIEHHKNNIFVKVQENVGQIFTDREQFSRILNNMLRNACTYTENGEIHLAISRENLRGVEYIKMELDDTGMAVPQDNINKLFKEFSYAEQSTFDGIGFDLAVSRRLCHALGGDIAITGKKLKGSSFTITLAAMMNQSIDEDSDDY